jgi:hypothetical protein
MPADENARMTWWMLRILKGADFTPDEVRLRRQIESLKGELAAAGTEKRVEVLVKTINGLVRQLNTLGTNAINVAVAPVSLEAERARLREREARRAEEARRAAAPPRAPVPRVWGPKSAPGRERPRPGVRECVNHQCRNGNPASARFCRRCGKVLA